jgi:hypothetical protein
MASANSTGVRSRADHSPRIAPAVGKAVHSVPVRGTDSDPHVDELLHRVRNPRSNMTALRNLEVEVAYLERDRQLAETIAHGLNEYNDYVQDAAA